MLLVYGKGYIASAVIAAWGDEACVSTVDICDTDAVHRELQAVRPTAVLNAAAFLWTARPADCEAERDKTFAVNARAPQAIAQITADLGIPFFHISTAFFYDGDNGGRGYAETDLPNALYGAYAQSKYAAECGLASFWHVAILRINKPFDNRFTAIAVGKNYLTKLLAYPKIFAVRSNMTSVPFFLDVLRRCEQECWTGVYHVVSADAPWTTEIRELYQQIVDPSAIFTVGLMSEEEKKFSPSFLLSTESLVQKGIVAPSALDDIRTIFAQMR